MHASTAPNVQRFPSAASPARVTALVLAGLATACGGSSGGSGQSGVPGTEVTKPGTDQTFFVDENQSGNAQNYQIEEVLWGRLVDVHEIDSNGNRVEDPVFEDFVVEPSILTNGTTYVLDRNPITQRERLTILARKRNLQMGEDSTAFDQLLAAATDALPSVTPKDDDGSSPPPFSTVPRNATVVLRFGDALDDDAAAAQTLPTTVRVFTGYPPTTPFSARVVFDPNHGAVVGGVFHSTRVLVDMTTSQAEANALPTPQDINPIGLPASLTSSAATNLSVRVPTETDVGSGQFQVLTNLSGVPVDIDANGPVDLTSPTLDVVRAMMSGNSDDPSNGFLTDVQRPRLIGGWAATVTAATDDPAGTAGRDFLVDLTFDTLCANAPAPGDVITVGASFLEVTAAGNLVGSDVADLPVRAASDTPDPLALLGSGLYQAPFHPSLALDEGCWVNFLPLAGTFPAAEVSTTAQILARFSEPMDPDSLSPYAGFSVIEGASGLASTANANNTVVGEVLSNTDLTVFTFGSSLPLPHVTGVATPFHVEIGDARDLAGNTLRHEPPFVDFTIAPIEPSQLNDAVVLRFDATDEYAPSQGGPDGRPDLRGQFFYDTQKGSILPRPVAFTGWPIDRTNPVPGAMTLFPGGVLTPLSPLGAKLQTVWRYCDAGWNVRDETKYNLDVVGLSWSPVGGLVVADFYDQFEIRLGHSRFLPDEDVDPATGAPRYPASGLPGSPALFESNYLAGSNPRVVHNRALGYTVNPANLFQATSGTPMMPFPLNRGPSPLSTYTWRDTAVLATGADGDQNQPGIPLGIEVVLGVDTGNIATFGQVPSYGLPLLIELRCYPADRGLGLNAFDVSTSNPIFTVPNFRAYSAGGINSQGQPVVVLPDLEDRPRGGFNPNSTPPGLATLTDADGIFYLGQLDTVVRVSRIHTAWLDTRVGASPTWRTPVQEPSPAEQPGGTQVRLDFRGVSGFSGTGTITAPFNASTFDVYGNQSTNTPTSDLTDWSSSISVGNGLRYLQVRMTFVNNITTGNSAELTALALPYEYQ